MKYDSMAYEMPWRPNYEFYSVCGWMSGAVGSYAIQYYTHMPADPFYWMSSISLGMGLTQLPYSYRLYRLHKNLKGRPLTFISQDKLKKTMNSLENSYWLGMGFAWEKRHAQRLFEITKRDWSSFQPQPSLWETLRSRVTGKRIFPPMGAKFIHGVEPDEHLLEFPLEHSEGHLLIIGSTGSGKTRMFDLLISQAIARNEAVIIVDPKSDKELRDNAYRACKAMGKEDKFVYFHPAHPELSWRIDCLRNCNRLTELASRISALIPSETGSDPFTAFSWQAVNNIIQGVAIIHVRPTLILIKRYLEGGTANLVEKAVEAYAAKVLPDWESKAESYRTGTTIMKRAYGMVNFYYHEVQHLKPNPDLESLLSMFQHDGTHFSKMVASLLPIMNMLTSGDLGAMLSPDPNDFTDERPITDSAKIINNGMVAVIGLDSLPDSMVGSCIGSLLLSDFTAVAGDRYNFNLEMNRVNIFVDECAEVINNPLIQLLNKGRGARITLAIATQTIADFTARLGSKDKAVQVLGNVNNLIALRVKDNETQQYICENLPQTRINYVMRTQGGNSASDEPILHGGNQGERLMEEEFPLIAPQMLGMLPNLEFIANISGGRILKGRLPILIG
ncbi:conjugative transfer system coupling protein TraD [Photobacterium ganghwense]|uniref:conjugative transfer system coupling protein TraD n=1 Tax=Photobacterium ganghwense TaxID=320778 RepID=UPI001A8FE2BC|nr:conjugative transfer system coupling protein TraD [Photobacterium ganghwense]QSV17589.1 conjugative transfer system coupling protein TraD [Photobacterium ganghwense]